MSCMIQKPENTAAIADYIAKLCNMSTDYNGMICPPESLVNCLNFDYGVTKPGYFDEELIYNALAGLNAAAYNGRYEKGGNSFEIIPYKPHPIACRVGYDNGHSIVAPWHYKMLKMIQFFNYQCAEDATYKSDLHKAMKELESTLAMFIVMNSEDYHSLRWE